MFKSLMDSITDLAQSCLLVIISNMKRLVASLPGSVSHHRAYSVANPAHPHAVTQQETTIYTHRTRGIQAQEDTAMDLAHSNRTSTCTTHARKRILDTLGIVTRPRAHSTAAPAPHHAVAQQETAAHTYESHDQNPREHRHHIVDVGTR